MTSAERSALVALLVGFGLLLACVGVAGPAGAVAADGQFAHGDSSDDQPPTIASAERVNDTAILLTIADNHDVAESTISVGQFATETGTITNVTATENGTNATVVLTLAEPVDEDNLTLGAIGNTAISDTAGNALGAGDGRRTVVVRGMDGVKPRVLSFSVTDATGSPARLSIEASEPLATFNVSVRGAVTDALDESDFSRDESGLTYTTTYTPATDGTVRFALYRYTDRAGNTRTLSIKRRIAVDLTPPEARAGLDLSASGNLSLVFEGGQSTDASGVANYTWDFGDGATATGERVTHVFDPGEYTVTMEAVDPYGNAATDTIPLNLSTGAGNATDVDEAVRDRRRDTAVTVQRATDAAGTDAVVTVDRARAGVPVEIAGGNESALASVGNVTLDGLNVTLATNRSLDLGVSLAGPAAVSDAAAATSVDPLAGITVVHAVPDREVTAATFSFGVNRSHLDALGVTPANVSLYRLHDGTWNEVPTRVENATDGPNASNGTVLLAAESPGFSRFALGATEGEGESGTGGSPSLRVVDAELDRSSVRVGDGVTVTVTLGNDGTAAGDYTAGLALNGTVVATATSPSIAPNETGTVRLQHTVETAGGLAVAVNGTAAGTLTVEPTTDDGGSAAAGDRAGEVDGPQFVVTNVSLNRTETAPGGAVLVNATVRNRDPNPGVYTAGLAVNGGLVATEQSSPIPGNASRTVSVPYRFNDTGEFSLSVNATTGGTVTVSSDGGGLLAPVFGVLAALPIPTGILQPLVTFVLAPLFVIWAILKALAIYLGY